MKIKTSLFRSVVFCIPILYVAACGGSSSGGGNSGDSNFKEAEKINFGESTKYVLADAEASFILPNEAGEVNPEYRLLSPEQLMNGAADQSIIESIYGLFVTSSVTKSDVTIESDVIDIQFRNSIAGTKDFIVTFKKTADQYFDQDNFAKRYVLALYNGTEWIPMDNVYKGDPNNQFKGDMKINKDTKKLQLAIISETNYVKKTGTIGIDKLMKFWDTDFRNDGDWNGDGSYEWVGGKTLSLIDPFFGVVTYQIENPYNNWASNFYFDNDEITYYIFGEKKTIKFSNYQEANPTSFGESRPSVDILLDGESVPVTYWEGTKKKLRIHIENTETINSDILVCRDQGVALRVPIGDTKDFVLDIPNICWNYVIFPSGYYFHSARCEWGDVTGRQVNPFISNVRLMPITDETQYFDSEKDLTTILNLSDTNQPDAPDGKAGPGYYNYPTKDIMKQHSFDIDKVIIKEGSKTYQFEVYPTKKIFQSWALGFDVYLKFSDDSTLETRTLQGRNVDFAAGDGWSKAIVMSNMYGFDAGPLHTLYDVAQNIRERNAPIAGDVIAGACRSAEGDAFIFTVRKSDIGTDLKTKLSGIQVLSYGNENWVYQYTWVCGNRLVNRTDLDIWHFSCNKAEFDMLHPGDAERVPVSHWNEILNRFVDGPYSWWLLTKMDPVWTSTTPLNNCFALNPYVLDILNGKDSDGGDITNTQLDSFSAEDACIDVNGDITDWRNWDRTKMDFAKIRMVAIP